MTHDRNCFVVSELKGQLQTQEQAESECQRRAATSNSNLTHYVVKVVSAYQRVQPTAVKVECRFSGVEK